MEKKEEKSKKIVSKVFNCFLMWMKTTRIKIEKFALEIEHRKHLSLLTAQGKNRRKKRTLAVEKNRL